MIFLILFLTFAKKNHYFVVGKSGGKWGILIFL